MILWWALHQDPTAFWEYQVYRNPAKRHSRHGISTRHTWLPQSAKSPRRVQQVRVEVLQKVDETIGVDVESAKATTIKRWLCP
jgi:hypothetical protein